MSDQGKKDWERPWTTEEIVEHADNWNLACDAALLNTLKAFGDKILNKSEEVYKKVETLCDNLDKTSLRVDLARNEFNSLRNTQFMECRVYEEDETILQENTQKEELENNVPKEETMEDLREAVALGLEVLDKYYDKVEVTVSDSEDEDDEMPSYVYRRKDPYINRPLPYVIGSEEWYKKWHVGLQESSDSENEKSASDKFSDSESEDNFKTKGDSDVSSELSNLSSSNNLKVQPVAVSTANTTLHNDFLASISASDTSAAQAPKVSSFAEQLAAKLGNVIQENEGLLREPEVNRRPIQKKPSDYGALFSDEPPPLDDNVIKEQESYGIFSGGKGLFDDEDEDDTLWNPVKLNKSSGNQFVPRESDQKTSSNITQSKGLFDEDSDDDIFGSVQKSSSNNPIKQPYLQSNKIAAPIFHEEPPLVEEEKKVDEKKKPTGGVSVFGNTDIFKNKKIGNILKQRKSSSSEGSIEDASPSDVENTPVPKNKPSKTTNETEKVSEPKKKTTNSNKPIISKVPEPTEENVSQKKKNILFEDDDLGLFNNDKPDKPKSKKSSLFDDDIFGDDLFSNVDNTFSSNLFKKELLFSDEIDEEPSHSKIKSTKEESKILMKSKGTEKPVVVSKEELFKDIEPDIKNEYDYSWRKNSKSKIDSLFDDTEDDDFDIFKPNKTESKSKLLDKDVNTKGEMQKPKDVENSQVKISSNAKPKLSLFDDEFEDVDDLFSEILKNDKKIMKNLSNKKEEVSVFDDTKKEPVIQNAEVQPSASKTQDDNSGRENEQPDIGKEPIVIQNVEVRAGESKMQDDSVDRVKEEPDKSHGVPGKLIDTISTTKEENETKIYDENIKEESGSSKEYSSSQVETVVSKEETEKLPELSSNLEISREKIEPINITPKVEEQGNEFKPQNSISVPHVSFLDSIPPPDDGWDNGSDNAFDDLEPYGNDGFHSQPSSLFDNEPPSLFFNNTSGIAVDHSDSRLDSVNSFDPSLTSSRRLSSDLFSDTQNNDSLFTAKTLNRISPSYLESVPEISDFNPDDNTDITPSGDPDNLYSSSKVNVTKQTNTNSETSETDDRLGKSAEESSKRESEPLFDNSILKDIVNDSSMNKPKVGEKPPIGKMKPNVQENVTANTKIEKLPNDIQQPEKNSSGSTDSNKPRLSDKPPISSRKPEMKNISADSSAQGSIQTKKENSLFEDLFGKDEIDDIFSIKANTTKPSDIEDSKIIENVINTDKAIGVKRVTFDKNLERDEIKISVEQVESDEMQSNISKIAERLQEISTKNEEKPKNLAVPRKLTHNININVNALLPGSAPPRRDKLQGPEEKPEIESFSKSLPAPKFSHGLASSEEIDFSRKPINISRTVSESDSSRKEYKLEKSISFDESVNVEVLHSVTKDRAKIPVKRRPSSRTARQKSLRDSVPDFKLLSDSIPNEEPEIHDTKNSPPIISTDTSTIPHEDNTKTKNEEIHIKKDQIDTKDVLEIPKTTGGTKDALEIPKTTENNRDVVKNSSISKEDNIIKDELKREVSLFDDLDPSETDNLFKVIQKDTKSVNEAKIISTKKREETQEEDEDDLFGIIRKESKNEIEIKDKLEEKNLKTENKTKSLFGDEQSYSRRGKEFGTEEDKPTNFDNDNKVQNMLSKNISTESKDTSILKDSLFDSSDDSDDFLKTSKSRKVVSEQEKLNEPSISIIGKLVEKPISPPIPEKPKPNKNLFDSSDDDDDFLKSLESRKGRKESKTSIKPAPSKKTRALFDDENDDDEDIFGASSSNKKTIKDIQPSVINKKIPKSSSLNKLKNIEVDEDPLSALLK